VIIAAKIANMRQGARTDLKPSDTGPKVISQTKAAEMLDVSTRSVRDAKAVINRGAPELVAAVEAGEISVRKAAESVRQKPEPEPPEALVERLGAKAKANTPKVVAQDARFKVKRDRALATLSAANVIAWLRQATVEERQQVKAWLDGNA
jgi:hypothetical protein